MPEISAEDRDKLFVTIEPAKRLRWDWYIEMLDPMAGFHERKTILVSVEDGDTARTRTDCESAARGNTKTKKGAEIEVGRALKKIREIRAHLRQNSIEHETTGGPVAGF